MTDIDAIALAQRLEYAKEIATAAGAGLMKHFGKISGFSTKASLADLVTVADQEADDYLRTAVTQSFPQDGLISEEADGLDAFKQRETHLEKFDFTWCIDPLDGTTNFVHTHPNFAVSIGLSYQARPVGGVIYAPARREIFEGSCHAPALLNGAAISVSNRGSIQQALVATGFSKAAGTSLEEPLRVLPRILSNCHGMRRGGSAALDLCDVACGRLDGYYEWGLAPWDVMAGHAIVESAGGRVSDCSGESHDPFGKNIVASNGLVHEGLLGLLVENSVVNPTSDGKHD